MAACRLLIDALGPSQLVCILAYGSSVFRSSPVNPRDVDLTAILRRHDGGDARILHTAYLASDQIDLTFQYLDDIPDASPDDYQFGNHGAFYAVMFASAVVVHGSNPFVDLATRVSPAALRASLVRQVREHLWRLQHSQARHGPDGSAFLREAHKYLIRIMQNMYFQRHAVDYSRFHTSTWPEWLDVFAASRTFSEEALTLARSVYESPSPAAAACGDLLRALCREQRILASA